MNKNEESFKILYFSKWSLQNESIIQQTCAEAAKIPQQLVITYFHNWWFSSMDSSALKPTNIQSSQA
jgi:hypothetical protein